MSPALRASVRSLLFAGATAVLLVAIAVLPFLTPPWLAFAQDRANAAAWTGYGQADLRTATDALVRDLVIGPPAFDVVVAGGPVLTERERAHLLDVRGVFAGLAILTAAAAGVIVVAFAWGRHRAATWRSARAGALALAGGVAVLGVVAAVAFEAAFAVFHRLLFAGNYTFDPRTDRLVQLFPDQLWFETSIAVGVVIVLLALAVAWGTGRQAARLAEDQEAPRLDREASRPGLGEVRP